MIDQAMAMAEDPQILIGVIVLLAATVIYQKQRGFGFEFEKLDPESRTEMLKNIFVEPAKNRGSRISTYVKMRSVSNKPELVGLAIRAKDNKVRIPSRNDQEGKEVEGTTYGIIQGKKPWKLKTKKTLLKLFGSLLYDRFVSTYDLPASSIQTTDDYIYIVTDSLIAKHNGVYRELSQEGTERINELAFSKIHQNYLETLGAIPEQYAMLNNRISGDIKIENIKSENIRDYMEGKTKSKKRSAMND